MDTGLPGLVVEIEARIDKLEKGLKRANAAQAKAANDMERRAKANADKISATYGKAGDGIAATFKRLALPFAGGLVGGIAGAGLTGIAERAHEVARGVAQIGDEAKRAGLSARAFQEWRFVAEQNRIGVDSLVDGFKELSLRADEFIVTGKGSAAEAFQRLGYTGEELARKLKDPSALMLEILGRLEQLDKAAQIRIADELFGGAGGERFVELLAQGEAGIRRTITEANALGIVMDDELIAKAAEVDRQFNLIATTVGTALKSAIVSAAASLADFIDGFREFQNQRDRTLQARQTEIMREKAEQAAGLDNLPAGRNGERGRAIINLRLRELDEEENQIIAELERRTEQTWRPKADTWTPPATGTGTSPGRTAGGARTSDDYGRAVQAITAETAALEAQGQALASASTTGKTYSDMLEYARQRAELLVAAQREGREITPALSAEIDRLAGAYATAGTSAEQAAERLRAVEAAGQRGAQALTSVFTGVLSGAMSAKEAVGQLVLQLAEMALQQRLIGMLAGAGSGSFLGTLGSFLTGGFAEGGYTGAGGKFEPAGIVHRGEFVFSKEATAKIGAGNLDRMHRHLKGYAAGGLVSDNAKIPLAPKLSKETSAHAPNITIAPTINVNATGGTSEANADLAKQIARETEGSMRALVRDEIGRQMRPGAMFNQGRR